MIRMLLVNCVVRIVTMPRMMFVNLSAMVMENVMVSMYQYAHEYPY